MGTYNLTNLVCETAGLPDPYSWAPQQKILISTGAWSAGGTASVTKISFKTPFFLNKNIKVTIQVKGVAETYKNAKYSSMTLSQVEYGARSIANSTGNWHNDISTTLANNRIGQTVTGVLSGTNVSFTLSNITLASNTTYYLYFVRKGAPMNYNVPDGKWENATESGYAAALNASNISVSLQMEISQLDAPVITTTKKVLPYSEEGETVTINWESVSSKTDNTLKNYRVYLRVGSKPTVSSYEILKETTSTSCNLSLAGIGRASKVYVGVQAISQYDEYKETQASIFGNCNSSVATLYLGDLNSLPTAPTLTKTGSVVSGNQSVDFTNFNSTDVDGQTLTYYYTLNGSNKIKITGSPLKLSLTLEKLRELGISNTGSYTINFFAFDTQEYGAEKAVTFRAEFAPVITDREFSVTEAETIGSEAGIAGSEKAISSITLSYTLEYEFSDLTPKVYIYNKTGENTFADPWILEPEYYTVDGKNIIIKPKDMPLDKIDYGTYFKVRFEVLNSSSLSSGLGEDSDASEVYRRPYMIPESEFPTMEVMNDAVQKGDSWNKYFKDYLTITVGEITLDSYYPIIEKITLLTRDKNDKLRTATFKVGDNIAKLNNAVPNPGDWCTLGLRLTDSVGQTIERNFSDKYYRVEGLSFNSGNYSISRGSINPCIEGQSFDITHPIAVSNKGAGDIPISYSYKYSIKNQEITVEVTSEALNEVTIKSTTSNIGVFKEAVKNIVDPITNFQGNGTITITAKDVFNQTATYSGLILETNTKTAPSFGTNSNFILRHNYDIDRDLTTQAIEIGNSEAATYKPEIFNSGEKIVFQIPKPTDANEDITNLKIYLYRNDLPKNIQDIISYSNIEFDKIAWLTIPITSSSLSEEGGYYYYNYITSPYSKNEYFYFKITAVDSLGAESLALTNSHYIIGARTVSSQIKVTSNSAQIEQSEDNSKAIVKLNLNLEILDLGGSAGLVDNKVSWDTDYYNIYPNFNRAAYYSNDNEPQWVNMIDYKWVQVEISPTADFSSGVKVAKQRLDSLQKEWKIDNLEWEFLDFQSGTNRVYIRVRLLVPYALTNTNSTSVTRAQVQGTPFIFSFFDQSPTVAYRPHQIGINVKNVNEEAVLEISQFNDYKKVILKRDSDKSIVIDIDKTTIDGIIINSGSW